MSGNGIRALVGALVYLGVIMFLLVGILANSVSSVPSTEKVKTLRFSGKDMNLFHVSKRKVPNGPDPIHNRFFILLLSNFSIFYICFFEFAFQISSWFRFVYTKKLIF